jgi:hypothetical protein
MTTQPATDLFDNPIGLDGFEFVEFSAPEKGVLEPVFEAMGFARIARHRSKDVDLWRQGGINFITNYEPHSPAWFFSREHGPSACGMGFRVRDAHKAYAELLARSAEPVQVATGPMELHLPGIRGIGNSIIYLIDRYERADENGEGDGALHLRHRFRVPAGRRQASRRRGSQADRSPDAQRLWRPHGLLGGLLRKALQLPRDPLFRHQGRIYRPYLQGADRARRQDPHSAQ